MLLYWLAVPIVYALAADIGLAAVSATQGQLAFGAFFLSTLMLSFILPFMSLLIWLAAKLLSNQVDMPARWTYSVGSALYGAGINYVFFHYGTVGMPPSIQQLAVVTWISTLVVLFWIGWGVGGQLDSKPYTRTS